MYKQDTKKKICTTCDKCNKSFNNLAILIDHKQTHAKNNKKAIRLPKTYKKKNCKFCHICCKNFISVAGFKSHMNKYHDQADSYRFPSKSNLIFTPTLKPTNKAYWIKTDIFNEFESELAFEIRHEEYTCKMCNIFFSNSMEYMEHEKIHFQIASVVQDNVCTAQESVTDQNKIIVSGIQCEDAFNGITCISCQSTFPSISDFEEHQNKGCKYVKHNNRKNLLNCDLNKHNIQKKDDQLPNKINVNTQLHEAHLKVLKQLNVVEEPFQCTFCQTNYEDLSHLEQHQLWWESKSPVELKVFECDICEETFTEEEKFKLHQDDHIKIII